jgi:uncharacterized protein (UPF0179 family)
MVRITLYPSTLSIPGREFIYIGEAPECAECKVRVICHDLRPGHRYRIVALREKEHDCAVHDGDKVRVVEYEELPLEIALPLRKAIEGAIVSIDDTECGSRWCEFNRFCRRISLPIGTRVKIISLGPDMECPGGTKMKRAIVEIEG